MPSDNRSSVPNRAGSDMPKMERNSAFHPWSLEGDHTALAQEAETRQQFRLLDIFLQRSGTCLLSVKLDFEIYNDGPQTVAPFIQSITSHCDRLENLKLFIPQRYLPSVVCTFPLLRSLKIGSFGDPEDLEDDSSITHAFRAAPLLRRIAFGLYLDIYHFMFPWSQVTVLDVNAMARHECTQILTHAVALVHCRIGIHLGRNPNAGQPIPSAVVLPFLETLVFTCVFPDALGALFNTLTFPALRRLQVMEFCLRPDPVHTLASFISRSRCNLQELYITYCGLPSDRYLGALPPVPILLFDGQLDATMFLEAKSDDEDDEEDEESD
ncbi:hypothetical protein FB451DRAFT_1439379 [Mycena latifolia]|nr:hypothetical protein FB451DRAFT_1439379 [Mycena latifolia]